MATVLKSWPEAWTRGTRGGGSKWDRFLDGQIWRLTRGHDYQNVAATVSALHTRARLAGKKARTHRLDDNTLVVQASPATEASQAVAPFVARALVR